ncbi:hypothetical protein L6164_012747 [Bauhinia variegata]|uniref:Uncharacterized protein n=1 Tax=Bauhinia variegata TaxID=167791 RepID=A0ACB9PC92_BAUVA|nr:hypothetical protein L6164_012747 [Bauhinia variegata]
MSSRGASLLAVSSLTTLCKGHSSNSVADPIRTLHMLKAISTAAERPDFQSAGGYHVDYSSGYQQNNDGFYRESQNHTDPQHLPNAQSPGKIFHGIDQIQMGVDYIAAETSHLSNAKPDEQSAGTYKGKLEELDSLCMDGKVKEAVKVLGLLEKHHVRVDLPRYLQFMHQCGEAKSLDEGKIIHQHVLRFMSARITEY